MGMIRRLNLTQSVFVLGEIELIVRFFSPHAPLKMARPDVFYVFLKKKICGKKCEYTKNQKYNGCLACGNRNFSGLPAKCFTELV